MAKVTIYKYRKVNACGDSRAFRISTLRNRSRPTVVDGPRVLRCVHRDVASINRLSKYRGFSGQREATVRPRVTAPPRRGHNAPLARMLVVESSVGGSRAFCAAHVAFKG